MARVLLAESDPNTQRVLQAILLRRGHQIALLEEAAALHDLLRDEAPDALICADPGLADEVRGAAPKVRILLLSRGLRTGAVASRASPSFLYAVHMPWARGELSQALDLLLRDDPSTR